MVSSMLPDDPLKHLLGSASLWLEFAVATPVVLWGGWPFFQRGLGIDRKPASEHVHADRAGHRRGVFLQRVRIAVSAIHSSIVPRHERSARGLF
jgi:hypothetical protein